MAASISWREKLNSHPLVKHLRRNNNDNSTQKQHADNKSLICVHGGDLYAWNASESNILHLNLKSLKHDHDEPNDSNENGQTDVKYQKLLVDILSTTNVEGISINRCGSHLVVWGSHGVRAVELTKRWGKNGVFPNGVELVSCRTVSIGERTFIGRHSLRIRQVTWHPGSKSDSHLALLTSDNVFSVYDIQQPDQPVSVSNINTGEVTTKYSPSKSLVGAALGDSFVAFDFGPVTMLKPKPKALPTINNTNPIEIWPVYCLRGNGEVMLIYSHLSQFRQVKLPIQGPLMMYPPAEDNYGADACSVLCLPTPFPLIVISTCEGRVHHCVQLPATQDIDTTQSDLFSSKVSSNMDIYESIPEPVLYVIETAELELCLSVPQFEGELPEGDDFLCPVRLKKDASSFDRYHCAHAAGVHSVALPWLNAVEQYFIDESRDFCMPDEKECIVEHLLCTKPLISCPTSPVLGVDVVSEPSLGPTLLILSSDLEFTALPIGMQYRLSSVQKRDDSFTDNKLSPFKHSVREPFSKQVEQVLQKRASNPLLKSGNSNTILSQQECFQLLSRVTQVLREEYIQRQDHARQELDTRIDILKEHKEHQLHDMKRLLDSRMMLREHARTIADRLETSKDNHEQLLKRLESVLRRLQSRVPVLSEAERSFAKELSKINDNMKLYEDSIEQVRVKQEYQDKQITKTSNVKLPNLHKKQLTQIYSVLKDEGEDIEKMKCDISRLNIASS